jgi:hypothetical protein
MDHRLDLERPSGSFRVVEVFEPLLPDIDGVEAYVTVEPVHDDGVGVGVGGVDLPARPDLLRRLRIGD